MIRAKIKGHRKIIYDAKLKGKVLLLDRPTYKEVIAAMKANDLKSMELICNDMGVDINEIPFFKCKL